jgi:hypothetical protein
MLAMGVSLYRTPYTGAEPGHAGEDIGVQKDRRQRITDLVRQ